MCTVTFFPKNNGEFILTSSRDESPGRSTLVPQEYKEGETKMIFPKDELAGGSWIGASTKNRLLCVLNGGFTFHKRNPPYKTSRGLILVQLLQVDDLQAYLNEKDWDGIEPFTMIIVDWDKELICSELIWDGQDSHYQHLPLSPKIWSSSTLYSEEMKTERKSWFDTFLLENKSEATDIWNFHLNGGEQNQEYGFVMDRFFVKTTSLTQAVLTQDSIRMTYMDMLSGEKSKSQLDHLSFQHE